MRWFIHLLLAVTLFMLCAEFIAYEATKNVFSILAFVASGVAVGHLIFVRGSRSEFDWSEIKSIWLYWGATIILLGMVYAWPIIYQEAGYA